jgi:hypothetical protein
VATNKVSKAEVALIFEVIPLINTFTKKFENLITDTLIHASLRHAAKIALQVLNKYYSLTDHWNIYQISICLLIHSSPFSSSVPNILFMKCSIQDSRHYFTHHKWPQTWIDKAINLLQTVWMATYKPAPVIPPPRPTPVPAPVVTGSHSKKTHINFNIVLNYGHQVNQGPDVLEEYLKSPPLPKELDPIRFWLKQRKAGEAMGNLSATVLAQMALDYISVPGLYFEMSFIVMDA